MAFHVRAGALLVTTLMRSNNALRLLPYNVFELSMLGELAAAQLAVPAGPYTHFANSLHIFDDEIANAAEARDSFPDTTRPSLMPAMPSTPDPWQEVGILVGFETELREASERGLQRRVDTILNSSARELSPYWYALMLVLASRDADRRPVPGIADRARASIEASHPFGPHLAAVGRA
jgi:hypothetical protein